MQLYVVGKYIMQTHKGSVWDFQGVFNSEEKAKEACINRNYFIGSVVLNSALPSESIIWPKCYYPLKGVN